MRAHLLPPWAIVAAAVIISAAAPAGADGQSQIMGDWYDCLYTAAAEFSAEPEPAQVITDAGFGRCADQEAKYIAAVGDGMRATVFQAKREVMTPKVLAYVVEIRVERQKRR